ncbi:hypothetical protein AHT39_001894 [Salmonella enterica subsp. enterica serovar Isangi]|nr:hypothetical protein [Salmonella enterica]EBF6654652.1 hypothetical protein [Salmonella enterica subsp. enterica serovar Infantis]EBS0090856.1 hypothetical protein [Salmonella enterica subsp. enterica serovar Tennessee]EBW2699277.1 hypothetical protein [Salmonella enterica subsp. enterica serovar Galiema]ECC3197702.1 hypothetical protein [Salmonella enterica subsp. enterica]ECD4475408.1 hypothetical protein [Salmonella enterica subsp. enterica serovar Livingstone]EDA3558294.1 hypothetical 
MSNIDKQALLNTDKHANQHRLSRLTMEVHTDELRIMASAVECYTDELIAALEAAEKRIAELEARTVKLPAARFCPAEYSGSQLWEEVEIWNKAIEACDAAIRAAGIGKGE